VVGAGFLFLISRAAIIIHLMAYLCHGGSLARFIIGHEFKWRVESRTGAATLASRWIFDRVFAAPPHSGLAWSRFLLPSRPGELRPEAESARGVVRVEENAAGFRSSLALSAVSSFVRV
jgi:hypothetical protein